jgi:hypothetical protein
MDFFIMKVKLLFLVISIFIISCSKKEQDNDLNQLNLKGNIVSIKEYRHKIDENSKYKIIENDSSLSYEYKFNKDGYLLFKNSLIYSDSIETSYFEYDSLNRKIHEIEYTKPRYTYYCKYKAKYHYPNDSVIVKEYYYNHGMEDEKNSIRFDTIELSQNKISKTKRYYYDNKIRYLESFKYDEFNNTTQRIFSSFDSKNNEKIWFENKYEYDKKNNMTLYQVIHPDEEKHNNFKTKYFYNKYSDIIKSIKTEYYQQEIRTIIYVYDKMNNWVLRETFKGDKLIFVDTRKIIYFNQ